LQQIRNDRRGRAVPSFFNLAVLKERTEELLDEAFRERPDLFLVDLKVSSAGDIKVVIDGDHHVAVEDCIYMSRAVEHNLDREEVDFSIEVTSSGVGTPLSLPRQFIKNVGRKLEVEMQNGVRETGMLVEADDVQAVIEWKAREPKPVGKGKVTVLKRLEMVYEQIKEARIVVTF